MFRASAGVISECPQACRQGPGELNAWDGLKDADTRIGGSLVLTQREHCFITEDGRLAAAGARLISLLPPTAIAWTPT